MAFRRRRRVAWCRFAQRLFQRTARCEIQRLHPCDEAFHLARNAVRNRQFTPQPFAGKAQPLPYLVVPQPCLALGELRADEEDRLNSEALQDRIGDRDVVAQAIVESDGHQARNTGASRTQSRHQVAERDDRELLLQVAQLPFELARLVPRRAVKAQDARCGCGALLVPGDA